MVENLFFVRLHSKLCKYCGSIKWNWKIEGDKKELQMNLFIHPTSHSFFFLPSSVKDENVFSLSVRHAVMMMMMSGYHTCYLLKYPIYLCFFPMPKKSFVLLCSSFIVNPYSSPCKSDGWLKDNFFHGWWVGVQVLVFPQSFPPKKMEIITHWILIQEYSHHFFVQLCTFFAQPKNFSVK